MGDQTLDVSFQQILFHYPADTNGLFWHHRVLLVQGDAGVWIAATPDHEVVVMDLGAEPA